MTTAWKIEVHVYIIEYQHRILTSLYYSCIHCTYNITLLSEDPNFDALWSHPPHREFHISIALSLSVVIGCDHMTEYCPLIGAQ